MPFFCRKRRINICFFHTCPPLRHKLVKNPILLCRHVAPAPVPACLVGLTIKSLALWQNYAFLGHSYIINLILIPEHYHHHQKHHHQYHYLSPPATIIHAHISAISQPLIVIEIPPGLQPTANGYHARLPGVLHCPRSKGQLSWQWEWLMV